MRRNCKLALAALRTPTGIAAVALCSVLAVLAVIAPDVWGDQAARMDPNALHQGSTARHLLGTDALGRDMLARVLVATRLSLLLAVLATLAGAGLGIPLGAATALMKPRASRRVAAIIGLVVAFPGILLALFLDVIIGVGSRGAVLAIGVASAPGFARIAQTLAASVASADYLAAARILGVRRGRALIRHVLPNIAEPLIVAITLALGGSLVSLAGLSFLGLGVQSPDYDWGRLLFEGLDRIYLTPWAALAPGIAIVIAGLAFTLLGETITHIAAQRPARSWRKRGGGPRTASAATPAYGGLAVPTDVILRVAHLSVTFPGPEGPVECVREVTFDLRAGERIGVVGESGSGKSLTAMALGQLIDHPGNVAAQQMTFLGEDLLTMTLKRRNRLLGPAMALVFQDPMTSFNPAIRIGRQLAEVAVTHGGVSRRTALARAVDKLQSVGIPAPAQRIRQYPHELSGGMRQRAMIGMGLMATPRLIIADEPTTALDVTVQQQVLRVLRSVGDETAAATIFISHDIAVVSQFCRRVLVMYAGRIVEDLTVEMLLSGPAHPYTRALIGALPDLASDREKPLATVPGRPPDPRERVVGCAFAPRCPSATDLCRTERPALETRSTEHRVACWHFAQASVDMPALTRSAQ